VGTRRSSSSFPSEIERAYNGNDKGCEMKIDKEIDTRGLNCPLPILKAKKALSELISGQTLKVVATDAGSVRDFQAFAKQTGNELLDQQTEGVEYIHVLRRR
jgi:TusA-related sulfurtransferase